MTERIGQEVGHYRIESRLGSGGMGEVFRARDLRLDRTVALKFVRSELRDQPEIWRRFQAEARALAAMDHPFVGTVHGLEEDAGEMFMVLAFVEGQSLDQQLRAGPLGSDRAGVLLPRIAEGLEAAHQRGVLHRDIKASNVLVGPGDVPRLVDFGLALRAGDARITLPGGLAVGTVSHMAPEVVAGDAADVRSDLWSLGVLCHQSLTGQLPFARADIASVLHAILHEDPPAFDSSLPATIRMLEPIVRGCLEKDPARRPSSAAEVAAALRSTGNPHSHGRTGAAFELDATRAAGPGARMGSPSRFVDAASPPDVRQSLPNSIAVLDFENLSGDATLQWLERGLAELLGTALSRSEELDVYDAWRLSELAGVLAAGDSSTGVLSGLGRAGIGRAVVGSVLRSGGRLRIQGRVLDVATGRVEFSDVVDGSAEGDVFELAGGLIRGLQTLLEVDLIGRRTGDEWLRQITTTSVDGYREYLVGRAAFLRSRWAEAAGHFRRALQLDANFIAARVDLTGCLWNLDDAGLHESLLQARRVTGSAGRRDRLQLELIESVVSGDAARMIRVASELLRAYPEHRFFRYLLGRGYHTAGEFREALAVLGPLVEARYEWAWTYFLAASCQRELGDPDGALQSFEVGMEVTSANPELALAFGQFLIQLGSPDRAVELLAQASRSPEIAQSPGYEATIRLDLGELLEQAGSLDRARYEFDRVLKCAADGSRELLAAQEAMVRISAPPGR